MNLFDLDDRVTAAAVAAAGTVVGALIQLRVAWRNEVSARARGVPVTKKSRRGPVAAVLLLLVAAAVAGFVLSQYLASQSDRESAQLRGELRTQIAQINATAERLEQASLDNHGTTAPADDARRAAGDVTVTAMIGPCRARAAAPAEAAPACSEQDAVPATLCASVPSASATAVDLYVRPENSSQPWAESRIAPGQAIGPVRFADQPFERAESEQTKLVCMAFSTWDAAQAYSVRLVVKYAYSPALRDVAHAALAPLPTQAPGPSEATGPATQAGAEPRPAEPATRVQAEPHPARLATQAQAEPRPARLATRAEVRPAPANPEPTAAR